MTTLTRVKEEWAKYMVTKDPHIIDIVLATIIGNALIQRDPLWTMIIAPSSGGKSTYIAPLAGLPSIFFCDDLTSKSFLSGYKVKGKEVSLLKIIGSGVLCFSDFTALLAKNPIERGEILGQLRLVYDGKFSKRTGTGEITWQGKIGMLAACTPDIYYLLETARSLGERNLYYTMEQPTDDEIIEKQRDVNISARDIAEAMHSFYRAYIDSVQAFVAQHGVPDLILTPEQEADIAAAAKFCVSAKATIHLDFKTNKPDALVSKPGVGRDRKMFQTLLHALHLMNCHETGDPEAPITPDMILLIKKCGWSSVGRERRKVLEILTRYDQPMTASEIGAADGFGLPKESVEKYIHALHAVGLVQMEKRGNAFAWSITEESTKSFVRAVAGVSDSVETLSLPVTEESVLDEQLNVF